MRILVFGFCLFILTHAISSAEVIQVPDDYRDIQTAIYAATDGDTVLVADGTYSGYGNRDISFEGKHIFLESENGPASCIIDCEGSESEPHRGFYFYSFENYESILSGFTIRNGNHNPGGGIQCYQSSPTIHNCIITENTTQWRGGGINLFQSNSLISDCIISDNIGFFDDPGASEDVFGGGVYAIGGNPSFSNCSIINNTAEQWLYGQPLAHGGGIFIYDAMMINCLIAGNSANNSGGGGLIDNDSILINCTIADNTAGIRSGGISCDSETVLINCIVWDNQPGAIFGLPIVTYSDIQGGHAGQGNIDADPLFVSGPQGEYYLSQIASGQVQDSPCINIGSETATSICFNTRIGLECLDSFTTRTDIIPDIELVDLGYHYSTTLPSPTPTPECDTLGIEIQLSSDYIYPYETFSLEIDLCNPGSETISFARVYLALEIYGQYFFWPSWMNFPDFDSRHIPPGLTEEILLNFIWPQTGTTGSATFIAIMTDAEFTEALGTWDIAGFQW